ncbi:MAG TPA: hypothetical protein VGI73_01545 [Solirubrobacterales bacterium]
MNFLKKGPELKLSEIRVPNFLLDLYYDLKERHLLPVAAVLLLAIVVVPFALTQSGHSEEAPEAAASASGAGAVEGSETLVAQSAPPLRKYQRRLSHLTAKNPFVQKYVEEEAGGGSGTPGTEEGVTSPESSPSGSEAGGQSSPESSSPEPSYVPTSPASEPSSSSNQNNPSEPGEGEPQGNLKWFSYAIDVRVVVRGEDANSSSAEKESGNEPKSSVRHNLPELTMLPSRKTPALTYMGSTKDGKKALMLVSSDVKSLFGDARCVIGSQTCQLLAMEPELPETVVYGDTGKTYTIELRKIQLVESSEINKAPLGEPAPKSAAPQGE